MSSSLSWYFLLLGAVVWTTTCYAGNGEPEWSAADREKMQGIRTRLSEVMKKVCDASVTEDKLKKVDECMTPPDMRGNPNHDQCYTQAFGEKTLSQKIQDVWCKMPKHDRHMKFDEVRKCVMEKEGKTTESSQPDVEKFIRHHEEKATCLERAMA